MSELSWESIEQEIADCRRCGLCEQRHHIVLGEGNRNAEIMLVGEGPGADEDDTAHSSTVLPTSTMRTPPVPL